ncbi:MAG: hypothetical protein LC687_07710 [Actinobacteria bacterium]|nr:hypothetical protein [Actinomycetota bacterium]MCA1807717.1 hypothetical protein [Actinomycetota bacterium]
MDLFSNPDLWIAVLSGGVLVKIVDYLLPAMLNKKKSGLEFDHSEKTDLREDIEYLRGEIENLRREVKDLRETLKHMEGEAAQWQRRYWRKKIELERVVWQVRHFGHEETKRRVLDTLDRVNWDEDSPETDAKP